MGLGTGFFGVTVFDGSDGFVNGFLDAWLGGLLEGLVAELSGGFFVAVVDGLGCGVEDGFAVLWPLGVLGLLG